MRPMMKHTRFLQAIRAFLLLVCLIGGWGLLSGRMVRTVHAQGTLSNQVLSLLSRINTWTVAQTFMDLRLTLGIPSITTNRIYADNSANLYWNGALLAGS